MFDPRKFLIWILCVALGIGAIQVLRKNRRSQPNVEITTTSAPPVSTLRGPVVSRVVDGDTLDCLVNGKIERIRLYGIDAPEGNQTYGTESTEHLRQLVDSEHFRIELTGKDRYGRSIAKVWNDFGYLNQVMVRDGAAWWYREYAANDVELAAAEAAARSERRGLWTNTRPIPPWDFR